MDSYILRKPDDFHIHLRDGLALARTVFDAQNNLARAIVMPNLVPAIDTLEKVLQYRQRIMDYCDEKQGFTPLMTLYLTSQLNQEIIKQAKKSGVIAVKWYPKGVTTNSNQGVNALSEVYKIAETLAKVQMPLLIHGEVTNSEIDIFDREVVFIDTVLIDLIKNFPELKVVLEHITTKQAVDFVKDNSENLGATITPQHLLFNRNALLVGGIKPHYYCLPILKTENDRRALIDAAISGDKRFFMGTDSAPHSQKNKESHCGCAGCYTGFAPISYYAEIFDRMQAMDKLQDFTSTFGAQFYGLELNQQKIRLIKKPITIPEKLSYENEVIIPFMAGQTLSWQIDRQ